MNREKVFVRVFLIGCVVFVVWWIVMFFTWFYPIVGSRIMFYELNAEEELVWQWCVSSMSQNERDAIAAYLIFGLPAFCVLVASPFAFFVSDKISKWRERRRKNE